MFVSKDSSRFLKDKWRRSGYFQVSWRQVSSMWHLIQAFIFKTSQFKRKSIKIHECLHPHIWNLLGLCAEVCRKNPLTNIHEVAITKNHVASYCVDPRLTQDFRSIFVSKYFVFRLKISQCAILITVLMSGGCIKTGWISFAVVPYRLFLPTKPIADERLIDERFSYKPSMYIPMHRVILPYTWFCMNVVYIPVHVNETIWPDNQL